MKYAINLASFGYVGHISCLTDLACGAERAGWGGALLWDPMNWKEMEFMPICGSHSA